MPKLYSDYARVCNGIHSEWHCDHRQALKCSTLLIADFCFYFRKTPILKFAVKQQSSSPGKKQKQKWKQSKQANNKQTKIIQYEKTGRKKEREKQL